MIISAHDLTRTRLCRAAGCPDDARNYTLFCPRHDQQHRNGTRIELQRPPEQLRNTLRCCACEEHLPDTAFSYSQAKPERRHRHQECRECCRLRRAQGRPPDNRVGARKRVRTPEQRVKANLANKARRLRIKAAREAAS